MALQDADGNRLPVDLKSLQKEVQVHRSLKHVHILEFMDSLLVKPDNDGHFYSGLYMLMELAQFGDLFDKIGETKHFLAYTKSADHLISCSSGYRRRTGLGQDLL